MFIRIFLTKKSIGVFLLLVTAVLLIASAWSRAVSQPIETAHSEADRVAYLRRSGYAVEQPLYQKEVVLDDAAVALLGAQTAPFVGQKLSLWCYAVNNHDRFDRVWLLQDDTRIIVCYPYRQKRSKISIC